MLSASSIIDATARFAGSDATAISVMSRQFLFGRRGQSHMAFSLIASFYELTGWTDVQIAQLLGTARSNVQAFRTGKLPENLTQEQRDKLLNAARAYQAQVQASVAEMELYS